MASHRERDRSDSIDAQGAALLRQSVLQLAESYLFQDHLESRVSYSALPRLRHEGGSSVRSGIVRLNLLGRLSLSPFGDFRAQKTDFVWLRPDKYGRQKLAQQPENSNILFWSDNASADLHDANRPGVDEVFERDSRLRTVLHNGCVVAQSNKIAGPTFI